MEQVCSTSTVIREPARDVPVLGAYEVVVCGGGPAGCAAALAAARQGARTLLVEREGALGGAPVTQGVMTVLSTNGVDFQGVWHEWARALHARGGISPIRREKRLDTTWWGGSVNPELVKYAWDDLLSRAGVNLLHLAPAVGVLVEHGRVRGVFVETRAGRRALVAERVVDCTGDGEICAAAGVPFDQGASGEPWAMGVSLSAWYGGAPVPPDYAFGSFNRLACGGRSMGRAPLFWAGLLRLLRVDPLDPWAVTRALREGRARVWEQFQERRSQPGLAGLFLAGVANVPGIRSSRRVRGLATVTADDAWDLRKAVTGIACGSWEIDVHPPATPADSGHHFDHPRRAGRRPKIEQGGYFDIPYGCLVPQGVEGLLVAGRCLSAEHEAQSSLRIQQTCMATGQAAGTAAALSLRQGVSPRELNVAALQAVLAADRLAVPPAVEVLEGFPGPSALAPQGAAAP